MCYLALVMPTIRTLALTALSLSIGWGIRGNFGHEIGALIPGALAAIAVVLTIGRSDWLERIGYFAFFGAIGWSFGGSMSYGQVLGYTHSGHSLSVIYGFASLFVIGFLWGAIGGAGTALSALLTRKRLAEFLMPLGLIFLAWWLQDRFEEWYVSVNSDFRQTSPLYWYDTDWLGVLVAFAVVAIYCLVRRRVDEASSLILHMSVGWWVGFVLLVLVLGLRMTPPRGDNWAGCIGMTAGMLIYFERRGLRDLTRAALLCGAVGGFGFAFADMLKLIGIATGWHTNWHSVMEQLYGAINGVGVALIMSDIADRAPDVSEDDACCVWDHSTAIFFVLIGITYLNFQRNPVEWVKAKAVPETILGVSAESWFALAYIALAVITLLLIRRHRKVPLEFIPQSSLGRAQLFYLVLLWWVVVGNFERSVVAFASTRLITEGVIFLNAAISTLVLMLIPLTVWQPAGNRQPQPRASLWTWKRTALLSSALVLVSVAGSWAIIRSIYGDQVAGQIKRQIRFGAESTATTDKPAAGQPHP